MMPPRRYAMLASITIIDPMKEKTFRPEHVLSLRHTANKEHMR
jgi:hypothetical protein